MSKNHQHKKQHDRKAIAEHLQQLEDELHALELWGGSAKRPSDQVLAQLSPMGINEIEFHEWLEYVLVERFRELLEQELPLPDYMLVHTYAQEVYRGEWGKYRKLIGILQELDKLISIREAEQK